MTITHPAKVTWQGKEYSTATALRTKQNVKPKPINRKKNPRRKYRGRMANTISVRHLPRRKNAKPQQYGVIQFAPWSILRRPRGTDNSHRWAKKAEVAK